MKNLKQHIYRPFGISVIIGMACSLTAIVLCSAALYALQLPVEINGVFAAFSLTAGCFASGFVLGKQKRKHGLKQGLQRWEKQLKETGNLEKKDLHRSFRKIDPEKLKAYVAAHPDAYQSEMAEAFGCSESGIRDALRRHKITRKKRRSTIRSRTGKR